MISNAKQLITTMVRSLEPHTFNACFKFQDGRSGGEFLHGEHLGQIFQILCYAAVFQDGVFFGNVHLLSRSSWTLTCPQKLNTLLLMTCWKPFTKLRATIITATLSVVAPMARPMMNRLKVFLFTPAIRLAMKKGTFKKGLFLVSFKSKLNMLLNDFNAL